MTTGFVLLAIAAELAVLVALLLFLRARGWSRERLGLQFSWKAAAVGIPLFIMYLLLYLVAVTLVLLVWSGARGLWTPGAATAPFWLMLLFLVATAAFEELTATAFAIAALARRGAAVAIAASTLLRFAYHLYEGPLAALGVLPIGLVFATMFWRWRNVTPLIVAHAIANVVMFGMR